MSSILQTHLPIRPPNARRRSAGRWSERPGCSSSGSDHWEIRFWRSRWWKRCMPGGPNFTSICWLRLPTPPNSSTASGRARDSGGGPAPRDRRISGWSRARACREIWKAPVRCRAEFPRRIDIIAFHPGERRPIAHRPGEIPSGMDLQRPHSIPAADLAAYGIGIPLKTSSLCSAGWISRFRTARAADFTWTPALRSVSVRDWKPPAWRTAARC